MFLIARFLLLPGRRATNTLRAHSGSCIPGFYKEKKIVSFSSARYLPWNPEFLSHMFVHQYDDVYSEHSIVIHNL